MSGQTGKRFYRKRVDFFRLLNKLKLWPSRSGILHGVKSIVEKGSYAEVTTHCNHVMIVRNSKRSRAARWLRNKWYFGICSECKIPEWKLRKYSQSFFTQHFGSNLMSSTENKQ